MNVADRTLWRHHFGLWIQKSHFSCEVINVVFTLWQIKSFKKSLKIDVFIFLLVIWVARPPYDFLSSVRVSLPHVLYIMKKEQNFKLSKSCQFWSPLFKSLNFKALYLPNYMSYDFQIWHGDRASQYLHILISRQLTAMPSSWCNFRLKTPMSKFSFCVL